MSGGKISSKMLKTLAIDEKLSTAQQKAEVKKRIQGLKEARDNYMMVGLPDDRPNAKQSAVAQ